MGRAGLLSGHDLTVICSQAPACRVVGSTHTPEEVVWGVRLRGLSMVLQAAKQAANSTQDAGSELLQPREEGWLGPTEDLALTGQRGHGTRYRRPLRGVI